MPNATSHASMAPAIAPSSGVRFMLGTRIICSFGAIFVLMLAMAAISYFRLKTIENDTVNLNRDSVPGLFYATALRTSMSESYRLIEQSLFEDTGDDAMKATLTHLPDVLRQDEEATNRYQTTVFSENDQADLRTFKTAYAQYLQQLNDVARQAAASRAQAQAAFVQQVTPAWKNLVKAADMLVKENREQAYNSTKLIQTEVDKTKLTLAVALAIVLLVAFITGYKLRRSITVPMARLVDVHNAMRTGNLSQRLDLRRTDEFGTLQNGFNQMSDELVGLVSQAQQSSLQVTTSVTQIAATAREQQATASETAATTTEIGATSREIFATSRDLLRMMNEVSSVSEQSAALAGDSQSGLTHMEETMRSVMEAAGSVNAKLVILNEKAVNINQVVATITKVADQTNLLSLNAAIEAEKAGEYGRGFAVVATEIRRLADQTGVATYDIEQTVKEIQSAVSAGVMGMDKFSEAVRRGMNEVQQVGGQLSQIIQEVQALAPRFQMVNEGMQTQATGAEQITQALSQLSEAAQQTADSLRQSTQAIDDLTLVANQLRTGVSRFKI
ncbi:MAG: methyl-accepting chemotaxis protein [Bordetella sp.]|uniref:methyl-accepting chemotaxis protein n=1 Tax=Bordetella sp. TaxID=28081 RepID=UPI003F7C8179